MNLKDTSDREIMWMTIVHVVFVMSGVFLALSDWLTDKSHGADHSDSHAPNPEGESEDEHSAKEAARKSVSAEKASERAAAKAAEAGRA
jgi:hypothetical protein